MDYKRPCDINTRETEGHTHTFEEIDNTTHLRGYASQPFWMEFDQL